MNNTYLWHQWVVSCDAEQAVNTSGVYLTICSHATLKRYDSEKVGRIRKKEDEDKKWQEEGEIKIMQNGKWGKSTYQVPYTTVATSGYTASSHQSTHLRYKAVLALWSTVIFFTLTSTTCTIPSLSAESLWWTRKAFAYKHFQDIQTLRPLHTSLRMISHRFIAVWRWWTGKVLSL